MIAKLLPVNNRLGQQFARTRIGTSKLLSTTLILRSAQVLSRRTISTGARREIELSFGGIVGMPNEIGHRRIAQHPSTIRQSGATETQHLAVRELDVDRCGIA